MLLTASDVEQVVKDHGQAARTEWERLAKLDKLVAGEHDKPRFSDSTEERKYAALWKQTTINLVGQTVNAYGQRLALDGFRTDSRDEQDASTPWLVWTRSGMPAKQKRLFKAALTHGYSYVHVAGSDDRPGAVLTATTGRQVWCHYRDPDDDWPEFALQTRKVKDANGTVSEVWCVWDDEQVWTAPVDRIGAVARLRATAEPHGIGRVPFSRIEADWGASRARGLVDPLIGLNNQINRVTFVLALIAENMSFQLRYFSGIELEKDENGKAIPPTIGPDKMAAFTDPQGKIGVVNPSDPTGLSNHWEKLHAKFFSLAQLPPTYMLGTMANLSAEALNAAESTFASALDDLCRLFGVGLDRALRLAAAVAKDDAAAENMDSHVVWAAVREKSLSAEVDGLGKAAQMLDVPKEALWEDIPGVTNQKIQRWKVLAEQQRARQPAAQLQALMGDDDEDTGR